MDAGIAAVTFCNSAIQLAAVTGVAATSTPPSASSNGQNPSNSPAFPLTPPQITCSYLSAILALKEPIMKSENEAGNT